MFIWCGLRNLDVTVTLLVGGSADTWGTGTFSAGCAINSSLFKKVGEKLSIIISFHQGLATREILINKVDLVAKAKSLFVYCSFITFQEVTSMAIICVLIIRIHSELDCRGSLGGNSFSPFCLALWEQDPARSHDLRKCPILHQLHLSKTKRRPENLFLLILQISYQQHCLHPNNVSEC